MRQRSRQTALCGLAGRQVDGVVYGVKVYNNDVTKVECNKRANKVQSARGVKSTACLREKRTISSAPTLFDFISCQIGVRNASQNALSSRRAKIMSFLSFAFEIPGQAITS